MPFATEGKAGMRRRLQLKTVAVGGAAALLLTACGGGDDAAKATQVAARVGGYEITVHQINAAVARLGQIGEAQIKQAGATVLERLIDQELLVGRAQEQKIDRDPAVMQAIDAARREIVARAYLERAVGQAVKPEDGEIKQFYQDNPELFAKRRVYAIQELNISATPERQAAIRAQLDKSASLDEFVGWLRRQDIPFTPAGGGIKAAEELPIEALRQIARLRDGQSGVLNTPTGMHIVHVARSREEPLDETAAKPMIERFLAARKQTKLAQDELKRLRDAAKVEYFGEFSAPAAAATAAAPQAAADAPQQTAIERGAAGLK